MANNYTEATLTPQVFLTPKQVAMLPCYGASYQLYEKDLHYIYWETCLNEEPDEDDVERALDRDEEGLLGKAFQAPPLAHFLHEILMNPENEGIILTVEGCHRCDKMRPGEFGGFALMVTRKEYAWINTGMLQTGKGGKIVPQPVKVVAF